MTNLAALENCLSAALLPNPPDHLGVAVSGGGDSTALLHLAARFCAQHPTKLHAVTVNHNLRHDAADEARKVGQICDALGVAHDTLQWHDNSRSGNLQGKARNARYDLIADWAKQRDVRLVALGHSADDQAETVLMRLSRRAGVDGLSAMQARRISRGVTWLRPMLGQRRDALRAYLRQENISWIDDPSNEDMAFDRIKAREALSVLEGLGINADVLAGVAQNMRSARIALNWHAFTAAREISSFDAGAVLLCDRRMRLLPDEIQRRILLRAVSWVAGTDYPPRRAAMNRLMETIRHGNGATLDGCHVRCVKGEIWIFREFEAVRGVTAHPAEAWDGRWRIMTAMPQLVTQDLFVRALGEDGLSQCKNWRDFGRPRAVLASTPSLWNGADVIAAPFAGVGENWQAHLDEGNESFFSGFLSH